MSKKKRYSMIFYLSENTWNMSGIPCPDCVDESNYQAWSRYLSKQIDKLLCAEAMQTAEFQEELEAVRRDKEEQLAHQKRLDEAAEVRRRRSPGCTGRGRGPGIGSSQSSRCPQWRPPRSWRARPCIWWWSG